MSNPANVLLIIAFVLFIIGVIDYPPATTNRCVALGLALLTLSFLIR